MIDMHSHILPNVDDGSRSFEETLQLVNEAYQAGFTTIVSTSHYYLGYYEPIEKDRKAHIDVILQEVKNTLPDLQICIGSEIYVTHKMVNLLKEHRASSINGTRYVLFELPFEEQIIDLKNIIFMLINNGYIPIIAHPERYKYVKKNPNILLELLEMGVLFQSNYGSIIGDYGKDAQKTVIKLLQNNFIHFLGSDVHRSHTIYTYIPNALDELKEIISEQKINELTTINPKLVIEDKKIDTRMPKPIKKGIFGF